MNRISKILFAAAIVISTAGAATLKPSQTPGEPATCKRATTMRPASSSWTILSKIQLCVFLAPMTAALPSRLPQFAARNKAAVYDRPRHLSSENSKSGGERRFASLFFRRREAA